MIDGWHERETCELRSKSKLSRNWAVQVILIVLSKREIALKLKKKFNQISMLTFMWSTPKEVNTQNLFMMQHWNIAAFEMTTERHLYFLIPPPHEARDHLAWFWWRNFKLTGVSDTDSTESLRWKNITIALTSVWKSG